MTKPLIISNEDIARYNLDSPHIPAIHASLLCDEAERLGFDSKPIAVACGRSRADLLLPKERISPVEIFKALEAAIGIIGHADFGFKYGRTIDSITSGKTTRVIFSAPTFGEAVDRIIQFTKKVPDVVAASVEIKDETYRIKVRAPWSSKILPRPMNIFFTEAHMSLVYKKTIDFFGHQPEGMVIRFSHPEPTGEGGFKEVEASVIYDTGENSLSYPTSLKDAPNVQYVKCLSDQAVRLCEEKLKEHAAQKTSSWIQQVKRIVAGQDMKCSPPTVLFVAEQLHASPRTLTRKLNREGTNFQNIVDQHRLTLAIKLLAKTNMPINLIAHELGFSDSSNFRRAFKKWSSKTPKEFRQDSKKVVSPSNE